MPKDFEKENLDKDAARRSGSKTKSKSKKSSKHKKRNLPYKSKLGKKDYEESQFDKYGISFEEE